MNYVKNLKYLSNLEILHLTLCNLCNKTFNALCNSMCNIPNLRELYLSRFEI